MWIKFSDSDSILNANLLSEISLRNKEITFGYTSGGYNRSSKKTYAHDIAARDAFDRITEALKENKDELIEI